ncbi:hypothetical protein [Streptosporangium sp. NPDC051022]|uniref:hypothetical protein n=1 Tax=Streptosporangium sp. NPDC051022 TaxID=3155752 RepID=UPI00343D610B
MYLVHVQVRSAAGSGLPADVAGRILAAAVPDERVEHVAVHPHAQPYPVLGVVIGADGLEQAEERAAAVVRRTLATHDELREWEQVTAQVPLIEPFYELLVDPDGPTGEAGGSPR